MSIPLKEYDTHRVVQKTWAIGQCKSKYHYTPVYNFVKSGPSSKVRHYRTQQLIGNHMYSDVVQGSCLAPKQPRAICWPLLVSALPTASVLP